MRMWAIGALLLVPLSALAQEKPAQEDVDEQESRQMRTVRFANGSTIRYEVLPDDDETPPGELIVMHFEKPAPATAASAPAEQARAVRTEPAAAEPPREQRDRCIDLRARLAARFLELRGLTGVDPDFALWVDRNRYIAGGTAPTIQIGSDPLLLTALSSDATARGIANELAGCETTQH